MLLADTAAAAPVARASDDVTPRTLTPLPEHHITARPLRFSPTSTEFSQNIVLYSRAPSGSFCNNARRDATWECGSVDMWPP